jgi:class 3 adenylate cyclase/pimeloyl-ACP methyl ester carboxylesterase
MAGTPGTRYAKTDDGVYLAYQTLGEGPVDIVWQPEWPGNIDFEWDDPLDGPFLRDLASFARVITHDQRGIGLSSRNVPLPDLETRVADLRHVLDAAGVGQAVLVGVYTSGGVNALLAATHPARVRSLVWIEPSPRSLWAPDYPWGVGADYHEADRAALAFWGTDEYGKRLRAYQQAFGNELPESVEAATARRSRNACTPDVAEALSTIWYATDVRGILPAVRCPTLLMARGDFTADTEAGYTASLVPNTTTVAMPGGEWSTDHIATEVRAIRSFIGIDAAPHLDSVLASILFTDIVGSTDRQAAIGDAAWKAVLERHHAIVRDGIQRWRGSEVDTAGDGFYATFEGPARAVRCALEISDAVRDVGLEIRAGVHVGECTLMDGKVGGLPVTIGARIAARASASEVLVSQTVKDLVPGSGLAFEDAGEHELKGVPDRWHLYRVVGLT